MKPHISFLNKQLFFFSSGERKKISYIKHFTNGLSLQYKSSLVVM